jgi:hypothetical protein
MPGLTHVLGPWIDGGSGKAQTQTIRRLSVARELISKLPKFDHFKQACRSTGIEGLAFQDYGFRVSLQFNFLIDCRGDLKQLWHNMHYKVRNVIRRAEQKFEVCPLDDPHEFISFYRGNQTKLGRAQTADVAVLPSAYAACREHDSGELLCARRPDGKASAMIFLVWGCGAMYYLMSTRSPDEGDSGAVNLLLWAAIQRAHKRSLMLDLDGVATKGMARFLAGFGGLEYPRSIVEKSNLLYETLRLSKRSVMGGGADETLSYT